MNLSQIALHRAALALLPAAILAGCATFQATPEETVQKRAAEYWKARQAGDFKQVYELSTPSYRKLRTYEQFRAQFGGSVGIASAEVTKVTCEPQKCVAKIKIGARPALPGMKLGTIPMYVDETWLLEDGRWWHYQEI